MSNVFFSVGIDGFITGYSGGPGNPLGDKGIRTSDGADVIQQFLDAGLIDEFMLHLHQ